MKSKLIVEWNNVVSEFDVDWRGREIITQEDVGELLFYSDAYAELQLTGTYPNLRIEAEDGFSANVTYDSNSNIFTSNIQYGATIIDGNEGSENGEV